MKAKPQHSNPCATRRHINSLVRSKDGMEPYSREKGGKKKHVAKDQTILDYTIQLVTRNMPKWFHPQ